MWLKFRNMVIFGGWYLKSAQKSENRAKEREMVTKNMETASHQKGSLKAIQNTAERYTWTDLKSGSILEFKNREKTHKFLTEKKKISTTQQVRV